MPLSGPKINKKPTLYLDTVPEAQITSEEKPEMVGRGLACAGGFITEKMVCPNGDYETDIHMNSCGRVGCPTCWTTWARRASNRAALRIKGYFELMPTKHLSRHATFDLVDLDPKKAKARAKELGLGDCVLVIHPWRIVGERKSEIGRACAVEGLKRYDIVRNSRNFDELTYYSPHAHVIGFGKANAIAEGSNTYEYRIISTLRTNADVEACFYYLLSHTFIPKTKNGATYWYCGKCSPQVLKPTWTNKRMEVLHCPKCREALVYPGTNICKEIKVVTQGGWYFVIKKQKKRGPAGPRVSLEGSHD